MAKPLLWIAGIQKEASEDGAKETKLPE